MPGLGRLGSFLEGSGSFSSILDGGHGESALTLHRGPETSADECIGSQDSSPTAPSPGGSASTPGCTDVTLIFAPGNGGIKVMSSVVGPGSASVL